MKARLLPANEDLETLLEVTNTWEITDWKGLPERSHSPAFEAGGFRWRLLLFPEGNHTHSISVYLECAPLKENMSDDEQDAQQQQQEGGDADALGGDMQVDGEETSAVSEEPEDHANDDVGNGIDVDNVEQIEAEADDELEWSVCGQFGFVMWNPEDSTVYHSSTAQHRFTGDEHDWGFSNFYDLRRVFTKHQDHDRALIEDNKVNITTYLRIVKDETGVLWHNFIKYNSKKETGFVGLKNQGATCYLNSLLQSLYFTKQFRRIVYQIPTEDDKLDSVPAALQTLFYLLRTEEQPVGTLALTRSFGWDSGDAFTQHDVQELNRVLMDKLEGKMKGTSVEGALNNIFVAQMKSYVKCVNVDFESSRIEDYWDIQLNVKGMKTLEDSFNDYIQVEMLEGENQYQATGFGLQDAKKGVVFKSFPPVLHLQLKRYEYDFYRDTMIKINDRYEFPLEIDLSPYLEEGSDMSEPWVYQLHGVLVHSGDLNAGHYYALLKPTKDGHWYKFDDDRVTRATMKEVLEDNFGGDLPYPNAQNGGRNPVRFNYKRHSSAYMLVYLRKSRLADILPDEDDAVPMHIPERIERTRQEEVARRRERDQQHFFMTALVMSNRQFTKYHGLDIAQWEVPTRAKGSPLFAVEDPDALPEMFRIRKTLSVGEFIEMLATHYGIKDTSKLRLWSIIGRQNKTRRLDAVITDLAETMERVKMKSAPRGPEVRLWLEEIEDDGMLSAPQKNGAVATKDSVNELPDTLIFFKYFDPQLQQLVGAGTLILDLNMRISEVAKLLVERMGWPHGTRLNLYEEVTSEMVEYMDTRMTLQECEINKGDVICFERSLSAAEAEAIEGYKNAKDFYDFLDQRIALTFRAKPASGFDSPREGDEEGTFTVWISRKDTYDRMAELAGQKLGVNPTHLQFFTTTSSGYHRTPIKRNGHTVQQILAPPYLNQYANVLIYYEVLEVSLAELENRRTVTVSWLSDGLSQEHKFELLLSKTATVAELVALLVEKAKIDAKHQLKIWAARDGHVVGTLGEQDHISVLPELAQVYVAQANEEEQELLRSETPDADKRIISVFHFQKEPSRTHGVPTTFVIRRGEPFSQTKLRLQKLYGFYDKVFEKIRFAIVGQDSYATPATVEDQTELFEEMGTDDELGLDHIDKTSRRGYGQQAAIFIKN